MFFCNFLIQLKGTWTLRRLQFSALICILEYIFSAENSYSNIFPAVGNIRLIYLAPITVFPPEHIIADGRIIQKYSVISLHSLQFYKNGHGKCIYTDEHNHIIVRPGSFGSRHSFSLEDSPRFESHSSIQKPNVHQFTKNTVWRNNSKLKGRKKKKPNRFRPFFSASYIDISYV